MCACSHEIYDVRMFPDERHDFELGQETFKVVDFHGGLENFDGHDLSRMALSFHGPLPHHSECTLTQERVLCLRRGGKLRILSSLCTK